MSEGTRMRAAGNQSLFSRAACWFLTCATPSIYPRTLLYTSLATPAASRTRMASSFFALAARCKAVLPSCGGRQVGSSGSELGQDARPHIRRAALNGTQQC